MPGGVSAFLAEEKSLALGTGGSRWLVLLRENRIYKEIQNALKAECGVTDSLPALSRYDQRHKLEFMASPEQSKRLPNDPPAFHTHPTAREAPGA